MSTPNVTPFVTLSLSLPGRGWAHAVVAANGAAEIYPPHNDNDDGPRYDTLGTAAVLTSATYNDEDYIR